ncbi:16S rRNA (guanine(527)-N(7))-methyltransferase RsmG [Cytophagales bacterium LB-30]|uniref:Ribosomal RNA small subunit methyltransferase G n=1 Tax=Shiella aurantiaca TaxID=3058365 RepID=A0ABT8F841_9BACT|nr:16S rRNA (guanine(527)-N(7))-methyltransferase RsmG [Shiella aurantiaca]MDN4166549.1 16S rRNA (guanine(527)-N(7))-methyltransferase RsmG [Shiella aurantiaca]
MQDSVALIKKYFPEITQEQEAQFAALKDLYSDWNSKINVISRKDIDHLYERHILHSLGIAKVQPFKAGSAVLDVGTGGGFPGIPLAILFPETDFHLVDSIGKKITVVKEVAKGLGLENVEAQQIRAEQLRNEYDFIVSRAVTQLSEFMGWIKGRILRGSMHKLSNGVLYLKGGDLTQEIKDSGKKARVFELSDYFEEEFFETKKVVYIKM